MSISVAMAVCNGEKYIEQQLIDGTYISNSLLSPKIELSLLLTLFSPIIDAMAV